MYYVLDRDRETEKVGKDKEREQDTCNTASPLNVTLILEGEDSGLECRSLCVVTYPLNQMGHCPAPINNYLKL